MRTLVTLYLVALYLVALYLVALYLVALYLVALVVRLVALALFPDPAYADSFGCARPPAHTTHRPGRQRALAGAGQGGRTRSARSP